MFLTQIMNALQDLRRVTLLLDYNLVKLFYHQELELLSVEGSFTQNLIDSRFRYDRNLIAASFQL